MAPQGNYEANIISFVVNGEVHTVSPATVPPDTRLVDYLRYNAAMPGTKVMCREGGCGACVVVATAPDLESNRTRTFSVQACQLLVYACANWELQTVEGLGNRHDGYHKVQRALAGFYGTQCGYCSPGMVMTMFGELERKGGQVTRSEAEAALDGNICRCTGYRPILDAFKSLAVDGDQKLKLKLADIEEAYKTTCPRTGQRCGGRRGDGSCRNGSTAGCPQRATPEGNLTRELSVSDGKQKWFYPTSGEGVMAAVKEATDQDKILFVAGNTGAGVFKHDGPYTMYVSLDGVPEMQKISVAAAPITVGARVPLNLCIDAFRKVAEGPDALPGYAHLKEVADHWMVVANLAVRNNGCWAGNLMMKNRHKDFPSDVFLTLALCDAELLIANATTGQPEHAEVIDVPNLDMNKKVVVAMSLPPMPSGTYVRTFKITPRAVNAHAYVNAAFRLPLSDDFTVTDRPRLLFGGLGSHFVSADKTEQYLVGKKISDASVVQEAARLLAEEATPSEDPHQGTVEYRRSLVQALFYKAVLGAVKDQTSPRLKSGAAKIVRGLNSGQQDFDANSDTWPIGQGLPKVESLVQVAGEAEFADDIALLPGELHGQFVQTTQANARIVGVDASAALAMPGVVDFVTAIDIPGTNNYFAFDVLGPPKPDPVFATDRSLYHGQPVGLVVAKDRATAQAAAKLVKITYADVKKPVLTIKEAIKLGKLTQSIGVDGKPVDSFTFGDQDVEGLMEKATNRLQGEVEVNTQYHFTMELMTARVVPIEDGYDVVSTTQFIHETQKVVASVLDVPANSVNMSVRRLGGGFGHKVTRCNLSAAAAAVAAAKTKKPVRIFQDLPTNMSSIGWREPYYATYEVGFDNDGKLQAATTRVYSGVGHVDNESTSVFQMHAALNAYACPSWRVTPRNALMDTAANTWCRTPGHVEYVGIAETILEHVAVHLGKDPQQVRELNLPAPGGDQPPHVVRDALFPLLKEKAELDLRKAEIREFNENNRWRKRGLSVTPLKYDFPYPPFVRYAAQVSIYEQDGTVAICHGGIEMGQGMNTKAVQVAAATLGVPMEIVVVKPTSSMTVANSNVTGGSYGSDLVCHGVKVCCERLKQRLDDFKKTQSADLEWPQLVKLALLMDVDLTERYWTHAKEHPKDYIIWGASCIEVEIDVLTGMHIIRRADVIEDAGRSLSPYVDVGQVEGAYVMGLGLLTTEYMQQHEQTGEKLVTGTWEYKPFTALDIPADFRVTLLPNAPNPHGVLRSKATGEPPLCMSYGIVFALREAIAAARADAGITGWFHLPSPLTVERIQQLCQVDRSQFEL